VLSRLRLKINLDGSKLGSSIILAADMLQCPQNSDERLPLGTICVPFDSSFMALLIVVLVAVSVLSTPHDYQRTTCNRGGQGSREPQLYMSMLRVRA